MILLFKLKTALGIQFLSQLEKMIQERPVIIMEESIQPDWIEEIKEVIKHMSVYSFAQGYVQKMNRVSYLANSTSIAMFNEALKESCLDQYTLRNLATEYMAFWFRNDPVHSFENQRMPSELERELAAIKKKKKLEASNSGHIDEIPNRKQKLYIINYYFKKALEVDPHDTNTLCQYANYFHYVKKNHAKAELYYIKALTANPWHFFARRHYALMMEDYDIVRDDLHQKFNVPWKIFASEMVLYLKENTTVENPFF